MTTTTSKLFFSNPGEIDIRAVTTLGVNVKPEGNPIGHFGTGLKYAIAGVLRLGGSVGIWSGVKYYQFHSLAQEIRGKSFNIVHMSNIDGDFPLGFTTDLGRDWEPWMLYRELRSNALDEGGDLDWSDSRETPEAGKTLIVVECEALHAVHMKSGEFWLRSEPIWSGHGLEVHDGRSSILFYHSIRATAPDSGKTADWAWVYNITDQLKLTEDRTLASFYDAKTLIAKALARCDHPEVLARVLGNEAEMGAFDFDHWDITASPEFVDEVFKRIERREKVPASARALVARGEPERLEEAELDIPSSFSDMESLAPKEAPEVKASKWAWESETSERIEGLEAELRYWKACAKKLGGQAGG